MFVYRTGNSEPVKTVTVESTSHTESDLPWGMYTVKVVAVNAHGIAGDEATAGPLTVGKPGRPAQPTATGGIGTLELSWLQPADDPDPPSTVFYAKVGRWAVGSRLSKDP